MTKLLKGTLITLALLAPMDGAIAGNFDGWCFMEDECAGPSKIQNDQFSTCEDNCRLTKPTNVSGMDGSLYDVICEGDGGSSKERMLLLRFKDSVGRTHALAVGKSGAQELARCD